MINYILFGQILVQYYFIRGKTEISQLKLGLSYRPLFYSQCCAAVVYIMYMQYVQKLILTMQSCW